MQSLAETPTEQIQMVSELLRNPWKNPTKTPFVPHIGITGRTQIVLEYIDQFHEFSCLWNKVHTANTVTLNLQMYNRALPTT
jgi:hypothetical protein